MARFMRQLPLTAQIILAPAIIVVLLSALIAWTLPQVKTVQQQIEYVRNQAFAGDQLQIALAAAKRVDNITHELEGATGESAGELRFNYQEQIDLMQGSLISALQYDVLPLQAKTQLQVELDRLNSRKEADIISLSDNFVNRLGEIQINSWIKKRTSFIDFYEQTNETSPNLIKTSLFTILLCIVITIVVSVWTITGIKQRLRLIAANARETAGIKLSECTTSVRKCDELESLDQHIRELTRRLVNVVGTESLLQGAEDERRRIAMDIHDQILSELTAVRRRLTELPTDTEKLTHELDTAIVNIRAVMDNLHPQTLDILGLEAAIRSHLEKQSANADIPKYHIAIDPDIDKRLSGHDKISLYRITLEGINNILSHADCSQFEINGRINAGEIIYSIEDNGVGLDTNQPQHPGHGIGNMEYRANAMNAALIWKPSRFSSGICLELRISLPAK